MSVEYDPNRIGTHRLDRIRRCEEDASLHSGAARTESRRSRYERHRSRAARRQLSADGQDPARLDGSQRGNATGPRRSDLPIGRLQRDADEPRRRLGAAYPSVGRSAARAGRVPGYDRLDQQSRSHEYQPRARQAANAGWAASPTIAALRRTPSIIRWAAAKGAARAAGIRVRRAACSPRAARPGRNANRRAAPLSGVVNRARTTPRFSAEFRGSWNRPPACSTHMNRPEAYSTTPEFKKPTGKHPWACHWFLSNVSLSAPP